MKRPVSSETISPVHRLRIYGTGLGQSGQQRSAEKLICRFGKSASIVNVAQSKTYKRIQINNNNSRRATPKLLLYRSHPGHVSIFSSILHDVRSPRDRDSSFLLRFCCGPLQTMRIHCRRKGSVCQLWKGKLALKCLRTP